MPISLVALHKKCLFMAICALMLQGYQIHGLDTSANHPAAFTPSKIQPGFNWNYLGENVPSWESFASKVPSWSTVTSTVSSKMPTTPSLDLKNSAMQAGKIVLSKAPKLDTSSWTMGNAFNYVRPSNKHIAQGLSALILGHFLNGQKNRLAIENRYKKLNDVLTRINNLRLSTGRNVASLIQERETEFNTKLIELATELNKENTSFWQYLTATQLNTPVWPRPLIVDDINKSIQQLNGWIPATFGLVNQASSNRLPNFLSQSFKDLREQLLSLRTYIQLSPGYTQDEIAFKADQKAKQAAQQAVRDAETKRKQDLKTAAMQRQEDNRRKEELHQAQLKALKAQEKAAKEQQRAVLPTYEQAQQDRR